MMSHFLLWLSAAFGVKFRQKITFASASEMAVDAGRFGEMNAAEKRDSAAYSTRTRWLSRPLCMNNTRYAAPAWWISMAG
ncbi:hypothetical protein AW40_24715 [Kosakonia radicincitans UMEnt01/12]|nr:hypothetical protein AW40_24715 [Kosakonia radicincitans UMEnt01/12]